MSERSIPWTDAPATTHGGPYSDIQWQEIWNSLFGAEAANAGVLKGVTNEYLASGATSPISINTGKAIVNGTWHISDASTPFTISTPAVSTRVDRIVLRKSFVSGSVLLTKITGVEGAGSPAITQSAGVTWDIPLWAASITTGGVITLTDERVFASFASVLPYPVQPGGRLTLTSLTPIVDLAAAGTLYYTPFRSNRVPIYVNGAWRNVQFSELSLVLSGLGATTLYDVFVAINSSGNPALELVAWSNSGAGTSTRATAITTQDGIYVKSGDASRTYLGTFRTVAANQMEDTDRSRLLWNAYNRVHRLGKATFPNSGWAYAVNTWHAPNGGLTTLGIYRTDLVIGLTLDRVRADHMYRLFAGLSAANGQGAGGICLDNTNTNHAQHNMGINATLTGSINFYANYLAQYRDYLQPGYHFLQTVEIGIVGNTVTFGGGDPTGTSGGCGMLTEILG